MKVSVNGNERDLAEDSTVDQLTEGKRLGVAISINGEIVPRSEWTSTHLQEADRVEILGAVQGG